MIWAMAAHEKFISSNYSLAYDTPLLSGDSIEKCTTAIDTFINPSGRIFFYNHQDLFSTLYIGKIFSTAGRQVDYFEQIRAYPKEYFDTQNVGSLWENFLTQKDEKMSTINFHMDPKYALFGTPGHTDRLSGFAVGASNGGLEFYYPVTVHVKDGASEYIENLMPHDHFDKVTPQRIIRTRDEIPATIKSVMDACDLHPRRNMG